MSVSSRSWMLEPVAFHRDFGDRLLGPDGLLAVRDRAVQIWDSPDPVIRTYLESLSVTTADDWYSSLEDDLLVDWYRVLMAPWLTPTRSLRTPDAVRRELPRLGWHATESRRLSRGRELLTLAERHLDERALDKVLHRFGWGHKGWLDNDDVLSALDRLRGLERRQFRENPDLVGLVENVFEVFEAAATKPDHVLLIIAD